MGFNSGFKGLIRLRLLTYLSMKMEQTECSETSAYKIQTPGNYPEENIQHTEHGESLKSIRYKMNCNTKKQKAVTTPYFVEEPG